MFCPKCGKQIKDDDNFCRFCGADLRLDDEELHPEKSSFKYKDENIDEPAFEYNGEELVLYEVKKHWMSLFWPVFLTPLFFIYFWMIFLNTHSLFSWIIVISMLILIIYPAARYKSDRIVVTTRSVHLKIGVIQPLEAEIPLEKINTFDITQSSMGRLLDYGTITFCLHSEKYDYPYIKYPEDLQYIIDNPNRFLKESLEEEVVQNNV